ncbi:helicase-related protein [Oceanicella sp. SM1341]|uniref:helicase-related protein n=1 Tax=Oceanicella sp. SM1341 TaxID=1548889 RepID=UPI000E48F42F|nr:helicase-related protein [Oceanicella sp. SM1341]
MLDTAHPRDRTVTAVLGPTNTGKTHYAIERMLGHRTGVIGLPLRLLAREVYDRIVGLRGPSVVALVTGEERIVPPRAQYWVCTVEAMPLEIGADFVAVDEIQLCADPERGHVFTNRLLFARGLHETLFLGSDTIRPRIASLIPQAQFQRRERFSNLTYAGSKKLSRLPERSAIVGFSVDNVYAVAELLRRQRGGAAVVMGALSPRTRNAQVALYQNGDVDYMVATDAIGMGLNLDVRHVAFAGLSKFDGHRHRRLHANELAQIAGRAGRHTNDGTFGVTGEAGPLDEEMIDAIEQHRFAPLSKLQYRNAKLEFGTVPGLIASLEAPAGHPDLIRAREADDLAALKALWADDAVRDSISGPKAVRRLWDVAQVPDFRKVSPTEHATLLARIYQFLSSGRACIPSDWLAGQIQRIDRTEGDIDAISKRLAYIRTWTYVAQRSGWVESEEHWRGETRAVEDRLSDALHERLTQRFVDRRTSVLMRRLKQRESLVAEVNETGDVTVEGQFVGRLEGFQFSPDPKAAGDEAKTLKAASLQALQVEFNRRADRFYNAPDPEIGMTEQGGLMWGEHAVGRLVAGPDALSPEVKAFVDESADPSVAEKVTRRLTHWINRRIAAQFEPLLALKNDESVTGLARGVAFRLVEALGVLPRAEVAADVKSLDQDARGMLRKHGVRFGQYTLFQQALLKPAPTQLRLVLWSLEQGLDEFPSAPPPGLVTIPEVQGAPEGYYARAGYHAAGPRAIRIDMLERLADQIRARDTRSGFEATPDMLSITGLTLEQFAALLSGLGYRAEQGERPKNRPGVAEGEAPAAAEAAPADADTAEADTAEAPAVSGDAPAEAAPEALSEEAAPVAEDAPAETAAETPAEEAPVETPVETAAEAPAEEAAPEAEAEAEAPAEAEAEVPAEAEAEAAPEVPAEGEDGAPAEMEVFYTFTWAPPRRDANRNRRKGPPRRDAKPEGEPSGRREGGKPSGGKGKKGKGKPRDEAQGGNKPRVYSSGQNRRPEKAIDPDNPFAALAALKLKKD